jgi:hypothetical protein
MSNSLPRPSLRTIAFQQTPDGWCAVDEKFQTQQLATPLNTPSDLAELLVESASTWSFARKIVILVASPTVLFCTLPESFDARRNSIESLRYRLESNLPFAAEDFVAAIQQDRSSKTVDQAIAMEIGNWQQLFSAIRDLGGVVTRVVPTAIARIQLLSNQSQASDSLRTLFATDCFSPTAYDYMVVDGGELIDWRHYRGSTRDVVTHLKVDALTDQSISSLAIDVDSSSTDELARELEESHFGIRKRGLPTSRPWFNLCVAPLLERSGTKPSMAATNFFVVAFLALLIAWTAASAWRGYQLRQITAGLEQTQVELYRNTFPGSSPPAALLRRFKSEHAKMIRTTTGARRVSQPTDGLETLGAFLSAVPTKTDFVVVNFVINGRDLSIDITCQELEAASRLGKALESVGFSVSPPKSELAAPNGFRATLETSYIADRSVFLAPIDSEDRNLENRDSGFRNSGFRDSGFRDSASGDIQR